MKFCISAVWPSPELIFSFLVLQMCMRNRTIGMTDFWGICRFLIIYINKGQGGGAGEVRCGEGSGAWCGGGGAG